MQVRRVRTGVMLLVAAGVVMTGPAAAASAGSRPDRPAGTGQVIAALNAVSSDASLAVGADSISTFLNPLCGSDLSERRGPAAWKSLRTASPPTCGWLDSVVTLPRHRAWAVGYQTTRTGKTLTLTEFYNGSRWTIEKSPNPGATDELFGVTATRSGTVWAVGFSATASSVIHSLILKRTRSGWARVPTPGGAELRGVTVTPSGPVWAGGAWHLVNAANRGRCTSTNANALNGVAVVSGRVYAVGQSDISTLAEQHVSGRWKIIRSGN